MKDKTLAQAALAADVLGFVLSVAVLVTVFTSVVSLGATIPTLFILVPLDIIISIFTVGAIILILYQDKIEGEEALVIGGGIITEVFEFIPAVGVFVGLIPTASLVYIWKHGLNDYKRKVGDI